jgi:hypothetical protein
MNDGKVEFLLFFGSMGIIVGLIFLFGAIGKWKIFVNPPEKFWWLYSGSFAKNFLDMEKKEFISLLFFWGIIALLIGVVSIYMALKYIF